MFDDKSYSLKMDKTIEVFSKELTSLRTEEQCCNA
jgi:ribosome recycling factor